MGEGGMVKGRREGRWGEYIEDSCIFGSTPPPICK